MPTESRGEGEPVKARLSKCEAGVRAKVLEKKLLLFGDLTFREYETVIWKNRAVVWKQGERYPISAATVVSSHMMR